MERFIPPQLKSQLKNLKEYLLKEKGIVQSQKSELHKKDKEIRRLRSLVTKDELTGVMNKRGFTEELYRIYSDIHYAQGNISARRHFYIDTVALLYIDVDNFKKVNDMYGHKMGDKLLRELVAIFEHQVRKIDFIGRLGGDEFAIALVGSSVDDAFVQADKIRHIVEDKIKLMKRKNVRRPPKITLSIGVVSSASADKPDKLIERGDKAMYEAKHDFGGNKAVKYLN